SKNFEAGNKVELQSKAEGFEGSYYKVTVINRVRKHEYYVKYKTLFTKDEKGLLKEVVDASEVRPIPPKIEVSRFKLLDIVAFDNDGWWVGKITGYGMEKYAVYFGTTVKKITLRS
ncbi:hypothetical protein GIB67_016001, partial [Kingdonia uniflora]